MIAAARAIGRTPKRAECNAACTIGRIYLTVGVAAVQMTLFRLAGWHARESKFRCPVLHETFILVIILRGLHVGVDNI